MRNKVEVGKVYRDMSGEHMLVLRDVPRDELGLRVDPSYEYVEVVFANRRDHSNGWRRKVDGKYPLYSHWPQHACHLVLEGDDK